MYYINKFYTPTKIKKKIQIKNFFSGMNGEVDSNLKSPSNPNVCFNFNPFDGSLKGAEGLSVLKFNGKTYSLPSGITCQKAYFYKRFDNDLGKRDDRIICYASSKYLYQCSINSNDGVFKVISDSYYQSAPIALNYNFYGSDVMLLSVDNGKISILDCDLLTHYNDTPKVSNMCIHNERLFVTSSDDINTVWFSGLYNPVVWNVSLDDAGYVSMPDERGKMLNLISFYDYVYLFREYGISRISAYGNQADFYVDNLFLKHGKIYGNSITVCGDYVVFLASDGLHKFDGVNCSKLMPYYDAYITGVNNEDCSGVYYDNKLYLLINMSLEGKVEKVVIVYDFKRNADYILKGFDLKQILCVNSENYTLIGVKKDNTIVEFNDSGEVLGVTLQKMWKNNPSDFGISESNKSLYKFTIETDYEIKLIINCDGEDYYYVLDKFDNELNLDIRGKRYTLTIISDNAKARIIAPTLYFSYLKERL